MTIPVVDSSGNTRAYPQSFDLDDLERYAEFVLARPHGTMVETLHRPELTAVRHDVDHSLEYAIRLALWEHKHGIRSSYYLLHTAWYWRNGPALVRGARLIEALGHEVGLHHDSLTVAHKIDGICAPLRLARTVMLSALGTLRRAGCDVRGVAAHASELGLDNLSVWGEWRLEDFGLSYEAYHLNAGCNYVSDNRGVLRSPMTHDERPTRLLVHPEHWQLP